MSAYYVSKVDMIHVWAEKGAEWAWEDHVIYRLGLAQSNLRQKVPTSSSGSRGQSVVPIRPPVSCKTTLATSSLPGFTGGADVHTLFVQYRYQYFNCYHLYALSFISKSKVTDNGGRCSVLHSARTVSSTGTKCAAQVGIPCVLRDTWLNIDHFLCC